MAHHPLEPLFAVVQRYPGVLEDDLYAEARAFEERLASSLGAAWEEACQENGVLRTGAEEAGQDGRVSSSWTMTPGHRGTLGLAARQADVSIVAAGGTGQDPVDGTFREELLLSSGRPALFLPQGGWEALPPAALIAWDGSREAARAVTAALPILRLVPRIAVATVGEGEEGAPGADAIAAYLRRHGMAPAVRVIERPDGRTEDCLRAEARDMGASLIVMGAYASQRWRELAFGGVTRAMLFDTEFSVLMAE